ncbi:divergent PAP2 family protein [Peribacillus simplex]|uniref:divergent PAP2 family protein n=1 Tax=Peribacillus simplex TaxID=1478 RepID=UPI003D2E9AC5
MELFFNYPLISALIAIFFAQFIKVPIHFIAFRKVNWSLLNSTGGMPSSHSAAVSALTVAVGIETGMDSPVFAVAAIFAVITMFDATGVRRQAGEQAAVLNQLVTDFNTFVEQAKNWQKKADKQKQQQLKELLGHKPIEVFFGALTGVFIALALHFFIFQG